MGVVVHARDLSTREAEAGGPMLNTVLSHTVSLQCRVHMALSQGEKKTPQSFTFKIEAGEIA